MARTLPAFVHKIMGGVLIEELRERAELTQNQVADHFGWSQPKVVNIETGVTAPKPTDLEELLGFLNAGTEWFTMITEHFIEGRKIAPKRDLRWKFSGEMRKVIDLESTAPMRYHASMMIPGLLQTEGYMLDVFRAYVPAYSEAEIEQYIALRLERQKVLANLDQMFEFIIDQAALNRLSNMPARRGQLLQLLDLADRTNIRLRFVPDSHGYYVGQEVDYAVFDYRGDPTVSVVYVERHDGLDVLHDSKSVSKYRALWDAQDKAALDPDASRSFLAVLSGTSRTL